MNTRKIGRFLWNAALVPLGFIRDEVEDLAHVFVGSMGLSLLLFAGAFTLSAWVAPDLKGAWLTAYCVGQAYLAIVACWKLGTWYLAAAAASDLVRKLDMVAIIKRILTGKFGKGFEELDELVNASLGRAGNIARGVVLAEWFLIIGCVILYAADVNRDSAGEGFWLVAASLLVAMAVVGRPEKDRIPSLGKWNARIALGAIALGAYLVYSGKPWGFAMGVPLSWWLAGAVLAVPALLGLLQSAGAVLTVSVVIWATAFSALVFHRQIAEVMPAANTVMYASHRAYAWNDDFKRVIQNYEDTLVFEPGTALRLTRRGPVLDAPENRYREVWDKPVEFQGQDDTIGFVPPAAKKVLVREIDLSDEPSISGRGGAPGHARLDPYAIRDLTGAEPVQVVSFNPASRPMAVTTNTTITHPLGDHRIMPAVHYGITQQWDSKTNWGSVFPAPRDSPVYAAAAGTVIGVYAAAPGSVSGVVIRHEPEQGTFYTRYLEVGEILVALGDNVAQNQVIARSDGKPGAPGARSDSREAHVRLEVWCMTQEYQAYFPVDPMTWIEGVNYQKIWVGPKEFLAYPIYPIPGTRDVYEFPVNRPVSVIANPVSAGDVVSIQVLDPQDASYVLNAQQRDSLWYRELITVKGKAYPVAPDGRTMWWQLYRFFTSHERAAYGQLIAGVNGFADAIPLDYGERELYASKDGWVCLGINDAVGILANNEQITDRSVDNYTKGGTRNVIRIKVAINQASTVGTR